MAFCGNGFWGRFRRQGRQLTPYYYLFFLIKKYYYYREGGIFAILKIAPRERGSCEIFHFYVFWPRHFQTLKIAIAKMPFCQSPDFINKSFPQKCHPLEIIELFFCHFPLAMAFLLFLQKTLDNFSAIK